MSGALKIDAVESRIRVERQACELLRFDHAAFDGLSDRDAYLLVLSKLRPNKRFDDKDDTYLTVYTSIVLGDALAEAKAKAPK